MTAEYTGALKRLDIQLSSNELVSRLSARPGYPMTKGDRVDTASKAWFMVGASSGGYQGTSNAEKNTSSSEYDAKSFGSSDYDNFEAPILEADQKPNERSECSDKQLSEMVAKHDDARNFLAFLGVWNLDQLAGVILTLALRKYAAPCR